jgi:hypothetical protein
MYLVEQHNPCGALNSLLFKYLSDAISHWQSLELAYKGPHKIYYLTSEFRKVEITK